MAKLSSKAKAQMKQLNTLRAEKKITVADLARDLGVPKGTLGCWLNGVHAMPEMYAASLAELLGVSVSDVPCIKKPMRKKYRLAKIDKPATAHAYKNTTTAPCTYKDNFWSKKRVEANRTLPEVAKTIGCSYSKIAKVFCGMTMPDDQMIKALCDMFDVDFIVGKGEFQKAYNEYKIIRGRKMVCCGDRRPRNPDDPNYKTDEAAAKKPKAPKKKNIEPTPIEVLSATNIDKRDAALVALYGNISYNDFVKISAIVTNGYGDDILPLIYGQVDFNLFGKVKELISKPD